MDLINTIKEKYLLEESIESLHKECLTWLSTISFWQNETEFYTKFINTTLFQNVKQEDKDRINKLFEDIVESDLNTLKEEILNHEKGLFHLITLTNGSVDHRLKHKELSHKISTLQEHMKFTKYAVFELFKLVSENYFNGNETLHIINERRAVRKYKKDPIDRIHIEQIIAAGRMAPSAINRQPWKFYVITNPDKIKRYSKEIQKVGNRVFHYILKKYFSQEDSIFHEAPVVIYITAKKKNEWSSLDIGMCAQNMMLAAKAMGYDTCPVGFAKAIEQTESYKELSIPSNEEIKLAIVLGYGDEKPKVHERKTNNVTFLS